MELTSPLQTCGFGDHPKSNYTIIISFIFLLSHNFVGKMHIIIKNLIKIQNC